MVQEQTRSQQFKNHFVAGAVGLSLSYSCMHPLDTIKTRIQANVAGNWRSVFSREMLHSLGKGFFVSAIGAAGQGGARFSTYEFCKSQMLPGQIKGARRKPSSWTIPVTALSAVLGDLASSVIKVPREVITTKLQTDHYGHGRVATAGNVVRQTLLEEGPRGLFKGFWAIATRDSPFMIILLVSYENFKAFHHKSVRHDLLRKNERTHAQPHIVANAAFEDLEADIPTLRSILYGGFSGFLAGYFTTPMDVLRTRMITQRVTTAQAPPTVLQTARAIFQRAVATTSPARPFQRTLHIYRAFFVGALPRSAWWFGICGIFFPSYETLKSILSNDQQ